MFKLSVYKNADLLYEQICYEKRDAEEQGWRICEFNTNESSDSNIKFDYKVENIEDGR